MTASAPGDEPSAQRRRDTAAKSPGARFVSRESSRRMNPSSPDGNTSGKNAWNKVTACSGLMYLNSTLNTNRRRRTRLRRPPCPRRAGASRASSRRGARTVTRSSPPVRGRPTVTGWAQPSSSSALRVVTDSTCLSATGTVPLPKSRLPEPSTTGKMNSRYSSIRSFSSSVWRTAVLPQVRQVRSRCHGQGLLESLWVLNHVAWTAMAQDRGPEEPPGIESPGARRHDLRETILARRIAPHHQGTTRPN